MFALWAKALRRALTREWPKLARYFTTGMWLPL